MVSTRGHPKDFPEPDLSPSKAVSTRTRKVKWAHTPSNLTLIWLLISLPLVIWDTFYVLLRPHTMRGGFLHWPLWVPYDLYGRIDQMYGWKAYNAHNGFTGAQGAMNAIETLMGLYYLYLMFIYGKPSKAQGRGAPKNSTVGILGEQRYIEGNKAAVAVLTLYTAVTMTLSKTILYSLNEYFSGFSHVGHNSVRDLILLWIIPNYPWIILPTYIMYVSGMEIIQGLNIAAGGPTAPEDPFLIKSE